MAIQSKKPKVLILEDTTEMRLQLEEFFQERGFETIAVDVGILGLAALKKYGDEIKLVICDEDMAIDTRFHPSDARELQQYPELKYFDVVDIIKNRRLHQMRRAIIETTKDETERQEMEVIPPEADLYDDCYEELRKKILACKSGHEFFNAAIAAGLTLPPMVFLSTIPGVALFEIKHNLRDLPHIEDFEEADDMIKKGELLTSSQGGQIGFLNKPSPKNMSEQQIAHSSNIISRSTGFDEEGWNALPEKIQARKFCEDHIYYLDLSKLEAHLKQRNLLPSWQERIERHTQFSLGQ